MYEKLTVKYGLENYPAKELFPPEDDENNDEVKIVDVKEQDSEDEKSLEEVREQTQEEENKPASVEN